MHSFRTRIFSRGLNYFPQYIIMYQCNYATKYCIHDSSGAKTRKGPICVDCEKNVNYLETFSTYIEYINNTY